MFEPVPKPVRVNLGFLGIPIRSSNWNLLPDFVRPKPLGGSVRPLPEPLEGWDIMKSFTFTIPKNSTTEDLTDFPVLIQLSESSGINNYDCSDFFKEITNEGESCKIAVEDVSTGKQYPVELSTYYDSFYGDNKRVNLWVRIPLLEWYKDTVLRFYYDNQKTPNIDYVSTVSKPTGKISLYPKSSTRFAVTDVEGCCVIKNAPDNYEMWYVSWDSAATLSGIFYCVSSNGQDWIDHRLAINKGTFGGYDTSYIMTPCVIKESPNFYKMWYPAYNCTNNRIIYCTSTNGIDWNDFQLAVDKGVEGTYDTVSAYIPWVIRESSTSYKMWYSASNGSNWRILYCTSTNGIHWTKPVLSVNIGTHTNNASGAMCPVVIKESPHLYKMWYSGTNSVYRILYAESSDGVNWTNHQLSHNYNNGMNSIDSNYAYVSCVIKESSNNYKMWYRGSTGIVYCTSINGRNWLDSYYLFSAGPVSLLDNSGLIGNFILRESATSYKMWCTLYDVSTNYRIGYCTSKDGINWTAPILCLPNNVQKTLDITHTMVGCVVKESDTLYRMWYGGYSGSSWRLLYAVSTNGINWTGYRSPFPSDSGCQWDVTNSYFPYVLKESETYYRMWYAGTVSGNANYDIIHCESYDGGLTWVNFRKSVDRGSYGTLDNTAVYHPCVIKIRSGLYKMVYTGYDGTTLRSFCCSSTDGISWTDFRLHININSEGTLDTTYIYHTAVLQESDNLYRTYYSASVVNKYKLLTYRSFEPLGFNNTLQVLKPNQEKNYDQSIIEAPCIIKESSTSYKMWYQASNGSDNHRILYSTSADGLVWSVPILSLNLNNLGGYDNIDAFYIWVIKESDTSYKMWYSGSNGTNVRIIYCTSINGIAWSNFQLSVNIGAHGTYDTNWAGVPCIIKESDNLYKMWYSGHNGSNYRILYCTSTDGIAWTNFSLAVNIGAQGTWDTTHVWRPSVVKETTGYRMWYTAANATSYRILCCESTDGITWTNFRLAIDIGLQGIEDTSHTRHCCVVKETDSYKIWYTGLNATTRSILYNRTATGINWIKPILSLNIGAQGTYDTSTVDSPFIIKESSTSYKMWYSGWNGTNYRIIYCTSTNGINWTNHQLSVNINSQGTYDTTKVYQPWVIKESDTSYKMWYSGDNGSNWRIIYCESTDGIIWTNFQLSVNVNSLPSYDASYALKPCVIKDSTGYKMWYSGWSSGTKWTIIYCESINGITWTNFRLSLNYNAQGTYDTQGSLYCFVMKEGVNFYRMWYTGTNGTNERILYCESYDGYTWFGHRLSIDYNLQGTYDTTHAENVFVLKESETVYKMWYGGYNGTNFRILYFESLSGHIKPVSIAVTNNQNTPGDNGGINVPMVIKESDNLYKMWLGVLDGSNIWRIGYKTSTDNLNWSSTLLVLDRAKQGTYDSSHVRDPWVIKESDTSYKMWYGGSNGSNWCIMYAISLDGIHWKDFRRVVPQGSQGTYDSNSAYYPCVIKESPTSYKMWYLGYDNSYYRILYCTSTDGITWTNFQLSLNIYTGTFDNNDANGVVGPSVIKEADNLYYMWYTASSSGWRLRVAQSTDGINWTNRRLVADVGNNGIYDGSGISAVKALKNTECYNLYAVTSSGVVHVVRYDVFLDKKVGNVKAPVIMNVNNLPAYDPTHIGQMYIIKESNTSYKMWYAGYNSNTPRILYCTSVDGVVWTNHQLSINIGAQGTYDSTGSHSPRVIKESDNIYKMWRCGVDVGNVRRILYCTSTDGITWTNHQVVINPGAQGDWDSTYAEFPFVLKESDNLYKMWYTGYKPSVYRIIYCESVDGITWTNFRKSIDVTICGTYTQNNVLVGSVIKEDGLYHIYFMGQSSANNQRIFHAVSIDGINWSEPIISRDISNTQGAYDSVHCSTPFVLRESANSYKMWYQVYNGTTWRFAYVHSKYPSLSHSNITLAVDNYKGPVYDWNFGHYLCWVIKESETSYKMWYSVYGDTTYRAGYTTSTDGRNWTMPPIESPLIGSQGTYDTPNIYGPCVIKESDTVYKMWYTGQTTTGRIIYCTSTNGINWTNFQLAVNIGSQGTYDTTHSTTPCVIKDSSGYKMWYSGHNGSTYRILYCESTDGINWTNFQLAVNIGSQGTYDTTHARYPFVIKEGEVYRMWYSGYNGTNYRIISCTSTNGITWTNFQLFLDINTLGTYDADRIIGVNIIKETDFYRVWYTTETITPSKGYIGYTEVRNGKYLTPSQSVWDNNFLAVYHTNKNPRTLLLDSTKNRKTGTAYGSMDLTSLNLSNWGRGIAFDGIDDYLTIPALLDLGKNDLFGTVEILSLKHQDRGNITVSTPRPNSNVAGAAINLGSSGYTHYWVQNLSSSPWVTSIVSNNAILPIGEVNYGALSSNGKLNNRLLFINGVSKWCTTNVAYTEQPNTTIDIGRYRNYTYNTEYHRAVLGELRISNIARSEAWINTTYKSLSDNLLQVSAFKNQPESSIYEYVLATIDSSLIPETLIDFPLYMSFGDLSGINQWDAKPIGEYLIGGNDEYTSLLLQPRTSTVVDSSEKNHQLTPTNVTFTTKTGSLNPKTFHFDGSSFITLADLGTDFNFGTGAFQIDMRIWFDSIPSVVTLFTGITAGDFFLAIPDTTHIGVGRQSVGYDINQSLTYLYTGQWWYLSFVREGGYLTIWLNNNVVCCIANTQNYVCTTGVQIGVGLVGNIEEFRVTKGIAPKHNIPARPYNKGYKHLVFKDSNNQKLYAEVEKWNMGAPDSYILAIDSSHPQIINRGNTSNTITTTATRTYDYLIGTPIGSNGSSGQAPIYIADRTKALLVNNSSKWNFVLRKWTVKFYIYKLSAADYYYPFSQVYHTSPYMGVYIGISTASAVVLYSNNNTLILATASNKVPINTWVHCCISYDQNFVRMFVDGKLAAISSKVSLQYYETDISIGRFNPSYSAGGDMFNGYLDAYYIQDGYAQINDFEKPSKPVDMDHLSANINLKVPVLSSTQNTNIKIYYKDTLTENSDYIGKTSSTPAQSVWPPMYQARYGMAQNPAAGGSCILDSTSNARHGTVNGGMLATDLVNCGKSYLSFDGNGDSISISNNIAATTNWTFGAFISPIKTLTNGDGIFLASGDGLCFADPGGRFCVLDNNNVSTSSHQPILGSWIFLTGDSVRNLYEDGSVFRVPLDNNGWGTSGTKICSGYAGETPGIHVRMVFKTDTVLSPNYIRTMYKSISDILINYSTRSW